jgi:hypothetical protein
MLGRPVLAIAMIVGPAVLALVGLGLSPQIQGRELEAVFVLQGWVGLGLLLIATGHGLARGVHRWLPRAMLAGTGTAAAAAVLLGSGALSGASFERGAAIGLLLAVVVGLAIAHGAAVLTIATAAAADTRIARAVRGLAVALSLAAVVMLGAVTLGFVDAPIELLDSEADGGRLPRFLAAVAVLGGSLMVLLTLLDWLDRRPELGGAVPRPSVRFRCPRCSRDQRQDGFAGCERCGLDVRVERL